MLVNEVFTPGTTPKYTYFERTQENLEFQLLEGMETPGFICSLSGPSKSGKTVLCEKVAGKRMLLITGSGIKTETTFWQRLRQRLDMPLNQTIGTVEERTVGGELEVKGKVGFLGLGGAEGGGRGKMESKLGDQEQKNFEGPDGVAILSHLRTNNIPLVVDDFHYIERQTQKTLIEYFKEAAREGNSIVLVSVTHRADAAIRANPDILGRLYCIDIPAWGDDELREIATKGFKLLNLSIDEQVINRVIKESCQSPQLMQLLCNRLCRVLLKIEEALPDKNHLSVSPSESQLDMLLEDTTRVTNCDFPISVLLSGARQRGKQRKIYKFKDGDEGDLYRVILTAISCSDPVLKLTLSKIKTIVDKIVIDPPIATHLERVVDQMYLIVQEKLEDQVVLEWEPDRSTLYITEPHFLYYLRWAKWKERFA